MFGFGEKGKKDQRFGELPVLQGAPGLVEEATAYRMTVVRRLAAGILLMDEGPAIWTDELSESLRKLDNAGWWLAQQESFSRVDDTVLVQLVTFSGIEIPGVEIVIFAETD